MTALDEQETVVQLGRSDDVVRIWTSDLRVLRRLRALADGSAKGNGMAKLGLVREVAGGSDWGDFRCDARNFNVLSAIRAKRTVSEAERAVKSARMREVRRRQLAEAVS